MVFVLAAILSGQLMAQGGSCTSCDKNKIGIRFASAICADKNINITLNGATASTQGDACTTATFAVSNWTHTELTIDKTYTITAGPQICSTHILFDVPSGYNLEINGEETTEINKAGPNKGDGDGTWNVVLKKCKSCSGTNAGDYCVLRNGSVEWSVGMGGLSDGRGAEAISIREDVLSSQIFTPAALIYSPPGKTNEVDVVRNPDGSLRQVKAPQALADIVVISSTEYEVRYYRPADAGSKVGGVYTVTGSPFTVWKIKNPDTSTTSRLQISKTQNGVTETNEFQADPTNGAWTLINNGGLRTETKFVTYPTANSRVETVIVKDNNQVIASKNEKYYYAFPWGEELVKAIAYPYDNSTLQAGALQSGELSAVEIAPLATEYAYFESPEDGYNYSKLKSVRHPDGSWEKYDYDNFGNIRLLLRPWKDLALENAMETNSHATYYYYTNFDGVITSLFDKQIDHIDESINGIRIRRTTYDRSSATLNSEPAVREVKTVYSSSSVGVATVTTRYHRTASNFYANRTAFIEYPDGRMDTYIYERGDYTMNSDPSLNQFTPNANGLAMRDTVIHGTTVAPDGIAFKTTKGVSIRNDKGQGVLDESYVYNGTNYERINWSVMDYDDASHLTQIRRNNGTVSTSVWTGDKLLSETDEYGIETTYTYDSLNRMKTRTKKGIAVGGGFPAQNDIVTTYVYDAQGRTTSETTAGGTLTLIKSSIYDLAGRIKSEKNQAGHTTLYDYTNGGRTQKTTLPGGATRISDNYLDGQSKSQTGTAVVAGFFDYGVNADGTLYTQEFVGDAGVNSPRWTRTTFNWVAQKINLEEPGSVLGINIIQTSVYDNKGQLKSVSALAGANPIAANVLFEYNELGQKIRNGLDLNANGVLDTASPDRLSESETIYEKIGGDWFQTATSRSYLIDNDATATTVVQKQRLTFTGAPSIASETIGIDANGQISTVRESIDRTAKKQSIVGDPAESNTDEVSITVNGLLQSNASGIAQSLTVYAYDALGRNTTTNSPQAGAITQNYDAATGELISRVHGSQTSAFEYYTAAHQNAGRVKSQTNPNGKKVYFEYNLRGETVRTWGDAVYPVKFVFDAYGQKTELHTYRGGKGWQLASFPVATAGTADVTKWIYHEATGLLNKKEDALGRQVTFTYDAANRLQTRKWARTDAGVPVQTVYSYHPGTGDVVTIDYSDATPDVTLGSNRGGRTTTLTDAAGNQTLSYNLKGELESITTTGGILDGVNLTIGYDSFLRRDGLQATHGTNTLIDQTYGYDANSRLDTVSSNGQTATNIYYPTSGLLKTTAFTGGTNIERVYDSLGRMQSITNTPAVGAAQSYTYTYNNLNQRTRTTREDGAYWSYIYNDRGELESGKKYWSDNSAVAGQQFEYSYDNIGNRHAAKNGGDASGSNLRQTNYPVYNSLNQNLQRTVPGAVDVLGTSDAAAIVSVNNQPTYRKGAYFHTVLNFDNSAGPVSSAVNVVGVKQNAGVNGEDAVEEKNGSVYLPAATETYSYDLDGNLLSDGRWQYAWDAENRLTSMTALSNVPSPAKKKLEFAYDYQGRRIQKKVYFWNAGSSSYQLQTTTRFVYDGWRLIAELDAGGVLIRNFVHTNQLLMVQQAGESYFAGYDSNDNVVSLTKASTGKTAAQYDYDPFGNILQENGEAAQFNPLKFSTKYTDSETNLVYYGYRYYNPQTGRWISKDPSEETGGVNLYGFLTNDSVNSTDYLGLWKRAGDWRGRRQNYSGTVEAEKCDTYGGLARQITGYASDNVYLQNGTGMVEVGQIVDIAPLLTRFENRLRESVVKAAGSFKLGGTFAVPKSIGYGSKFVNRYFTSNKFAADCTLAQSLVLAKGLIDYLRKGEFDKLGYGLAFGPPDSSQMPTQVTKVGSISDALPGDATYIANFEDYKKITSDPHRTWQGESVIAMPNGKFWGNPFGTQDYNFFEEALKQRYRAEGGLQTKNFPGFVGEVMFVNVSEVAMSVFDLRKNSK